MLDSTDPDEGVKASVESEAEGFRLLDILADYDLFQYENKIKPDFANTGWLERYEDWGSEGMVWVDVEVEYSSIMLNYSSIM